MGSTSNYSWPTPESTDLVKDGWEAIKDLGDAADASLKTVADASGLVHINTTSFSAVASQSLNDIFTADYNFYRLIFRIESKSTTSSTFLRFRASGTDNTSNEYAFGFIGRTPGTTTQIESNGTSAFILSSSNDQSQTTSLDISYPFQTGRTHIEGTIIQRTGQTGFGGGGQMLVDTSYDGFTLLPSAGNITGILSIFAYKE